MELWVLMEEHW